MAVEGDAEIVRSRLGKLVVGQRKSLSYAVRVTLRKPSEALPRRNAPAATTTSNG